jgi:hypothetical protein
MNVATAPATPGALPQHLSDILRSGLQAPSAENRHYLRFEIAGDAVRLVSTDTATWAEQPHRQMLALLAYGAVVENMSLHAAQAGQSQTTRWLPEAARPELIAECRWTASTPVTDPLAQAIPNRHTNRRFYQRTPVPEEIRARVSAAASAVPQARLVWLDDAAARRTALRVIRVAETERFRHEALHRELFGAIEFEAGWQRSTAEGLPPGTLEVEPPMRPAFAALRHWPLMRALSRIGVHHLLGLRAAYMPARLCPHLALLACDIDDPTLAALNAGRALERTWLAATHEGLAVQPMAAAPVLARQRPGGGWVSAPAQQRILQGLGELTGGRAFSAFMLVRVGHAPAPSLVTGRRDLGEFLAS